jgi:molybdopterin-guanine dinucleotide biosynthesis protein B
VNEQFSAHTPPPTVAFIGPSGSGKTTLIESLVALLTTRGYRVGAIKKSHHGIEIDTKGKDSHRFAAAGAKAVGLVSRGGFALMVSTPAPLSLTEAVEFFHPFADIVLIEGYGEELLQGTPAPTFWFPDDREEPPGVVARILPHATESNYAIMSIGRDDVDGVATFIIRNYLTGK